MLSEVVTDYQEAASWCLAVKITYTMPAALAWRAIRPGWPSGLAPVVACSAVSTHFLGGSKPERKNAPGGTACNLIKSLGASTSGDRYF